MEVLIDGKFSRLGGQPFPSDMGGCYLRGYLYVNRQLALTLKCLQPLREPMKVNDGHLVEGLWLWRQRVDTDAVALAYFIAIIRCSVL